MAASAQATTNGQELPHRTPGSGIRSVAATATAAAVAVATTGSTCARSDPDTTRSRRHAITSATAAPRARSTTPAMKAGGRVISEDDVRHTRLDPAPKGSLRSCQTSVPKIVTAVPVHANAGATKDRRPATAP